MSGVLRYFAPALFWLFTAGCGQTQLGAANNDPEPTGTIVAQASFSGVNGKSASGNAIIYHTSGSAYILRLSGVNFPTETGLELIVVANSVNLSPMILRSGTGNQNYSFSVSSDSPVFNQVKLYSTLAFKNYAEALFVN